MSWLKNAWHSIKKATKSPIFHVVEGGLALAFPAVAIPAAAALTMGNKALDMANSSNAAVRAKYRTVVENTEKAAAAGHPHAQRAVAAMKLAKDAKAGHPAALAEVAKIRAHGTHQRLAAQAIVRRYKMHPRTGVVQLRPKQRGGAISGDDDYAPEEEQEQQEDESSPDDSGGDGGGGGGGGGGPGMPAAALALATGARALDNAQSPDPSVAAQGQAAVKRAVHHARAGHPAAKRAVAAMTLVHHARAGNPVAKKRVAHIQKHAKPKRHG